MKKEKFQLYLSTLISGIFITMFISSLVTYLALSDTSLFLQVWPKNWFYASLVAFPAILFVRPLAIKLTAIITNYIYK
ncbi:MAG: DUF2798 domain-containing protein [Candidatus Puniceispirillales bacterium]|jgi:hypothetical protein|nr:DUF2798 domain-containing protein [Alphaproteobacteria bacterium]MBL6851240.1 DUF2798 domain-containing protein [Alphaproteobacteria bacterium]